MSLLMNLGLKLDDVRRETLAILNGQPASSAMDWLFATTAEDIAKEYRDSALESAKDLRNWVDHIIAELPKCERGAFCAGWIDELIKKTYSVAYQVGQANGAVLVRGTKPEK